MSDTATTKAPVREPRPEKVAKVAEIASMIEAADAVFVSEYRGLSVSQLANLRSQLRPAGAQHVVLKNNLVRRAATEAGVGELNDYLVGPNAITFVTGDVAAAAKALKESSKAHPTLVIKGGVLGDALLSEADVLALADLPSRDELLALLAGAFQAPLSKTARLLQAVPAKFAYGLAALIEQREAA